MHVEKIQSIRVGHLRHSRSQSQTVWGVMEERIVGDFHFVIVNARRPGIEADRVGIADEVNLMPAVGQLEAQFRRDDAAAAVGGVTGNPDGHGVL